MIERTKNVFFILVAIITVLIIGYALHVSSLKYESLLKPIEYDDSVVNALNGACKSYSGVKHFTITQAPLTVTVTCNFSNEVFSTIREVYIIRDSTPILNKK